MSSPNIVLAQQPPNLYPAPNGVCADEPLQLGITTDHGEDDVSRNPSLVFLLV